MNNREFAQVLLSEATSLLEGIQIKTSKTKDKEDPMEVFKLLKEVEAPLGIKLTSENIKNILKPCPMRDLTACVVIAYYEDINLGKDKKIINQINKYIIQLNKIARKYKYYITRTIDKYEDMHVIQIWFNTNKKDKMKD